MPIWYLPFLYIIRICTLWWGDMSRPRDSGEQPRAILALLFKYLIGRSCWTFGDVDIIIITFPQCLKKNLWFALKDKEEVFILLLNYSKQSHVLPRHLRRHSRVLMAQRNTMSNSYLISRHSTVLSHQYLFKMGQYSRTTLKGRSKQKIWTQKYL